jgi:dienelactone hydrolase
MRPAARLLALLCVAMPASIPAPAPAQEPARVRLLTASELPRLSEGLELPAGRYAVKVWAPSRERWAVAEADGTRGLALTVEGEDRTPRWGDAGAVTVREGEPLRLAIPGLEAILAPPPADGAAKKQEAAPAPPVVPAAVCFGPEAGFDPAVLLDLIRARVDTTGPPADARRAAVRTNQQGAGFRAPATLPAWRDRADRLREGLRVTLGLWPEFPRTPIAATVHGTLERDGYAIDRVTIETMPGVLLGGNLYRPKGTTGRRPAILSPHGHYAEGRVHEDVQARCVRWATLGYVVFLHDMVGYNDSKPFGHAFFNPRLDRWGYSLGTLQTWNSIRALDWLASRPDVDPARIGCTGESGGGTQTFLLTALDPRVAAAAPVVMVSDAFQGGCVCENAPGLRVGTDNVEIAALAAPRPMKLVGASGDWTAGTATTIAPSIRAVYELFGMSSRFSADIFDFGHNYNQTSRNAVYPFLARWLDGDDDYARVREGEIGIEKPEDLRVFDETNPAPASVKTPEQLEAALIDLRARQLARLAPGDQAVPWEAARASLHQALAIRVGLSNPSAADLQASPVRRVFRPGFVAVHRVVTRAGTGESVPFVRLIPPRPSGRVSVILSPHGKRALFGPDGEPAPIVKALLDRGHGVVGLDPLLIGESADPAAFRDRRPDTAHFETYNKALAADRLQDLATALAWVRSQPDVVQVNLVGQGRWGALALLARPALEGVGRTAIDLHGFSYGDGSDVPDDLHLPGVLQFGGLDGAAALCAPAPLWVHRAGGLDASWPVKGYALAGVPGLLRLDDGRAEPDALARWLDTGE